MSIPYQIIPERRGNGFGCRPGVEQVVHGLFLLFGHGEELGDGDDEDRDGEGAPEGGQHDDQTPENGVCGHISEADRGDCDDDAVERGEVVVEGYHPQLRIVGLFKQLQ